MNSARDVVYMLERGAKNRATADTSMNEHSSRSHQVLTVIVEGSDKTNGMRTFGCLSLIDLAGSERVDRSGAKGAGAGERGGGSSWGGARHAPWGMTA